MKKVEIIMVLSVVSFIISAMLFILSGILFIKYDIREIVDVLTGKKALRSISKMNKVKQLQDRENDDIYQKNFLSNTVMQKLNTNNNKLSRATDMLEDEYTTDILKFDSYEKEINFKIIKDEISIFIEDDN